MKYFKYSGSKIVTPHTWAHTGKKVTTLCCTLIYFFQMFCHRGVFCPSQCLLLYQVGNTSSRKNTEATWATVSTWMGDHSMVMDVDVVYSYKYTVKSQRRRNGASLIYMRMEPQNNISWIVVSDLISLKSIPIVVYGVTAQVSDPD